MSEQTIGGRYGVGRGKGWALKAHAHSLATGWEWIALLTALLSSLWLKSPDGQKIGSWNTGAQCSIPILSQGYGRPDEPATLSVKLDHGASNNVTTPLPSKAAI